MYLYSLFFIIRVLDLKIILQFVDLVNAKYTRSESVVIYPLNSLQIYISAAYKLSAP